MARRPAAETSRGRPFLAAALALNVIGIAFIHSTTADGRPFPSPAAQGQILKAAIGLAAFFIVSRLDYRIFDRAAYAIYAGLCAVLCAMIVLRFASGEAHRYFELKLFQVQPSELMKLSLVLALARYLRFREDQGQVAGLVGPFLLTLVPMALVLLQPDLGTSLMFPPILVCMLFIAGARPRHLLTAVAIGLALLPVAYFAGDSLRMIPAYQRDRITAYVQRDEATARNEGFHLRQSEIAIGSGGFQGKGYNEGTQNVLKHLRESHTDFIFSIIAEEAGFLGGVLVIGLAAFLACSLAQVGVATREPFGRLVAAGVAAGFAAQSFENIGMTMGLTPITGVPLPFVSLGGSSLVASYLALGVVVSIVSRPVRVVASRDLEPVDARQPSLVFDRQARGLLEHRWPTE
jgi:rod shape determining protein RodA